MIEHNKRKKLGKKYKNSHLVFILTSTIVNNQHPSESLNSSVYFIEMAPAGKHSRGRNEYVENIKISTKYHSLSKVISGIAKSVNKHDSSAEISYDLSKFTKALRNLLNANSKLLLMGHITNDESHFEENTATMQFLDKCRSLYLESFPHLFDPTGMVQNQDKLLVKLTQENFELKNNLKNFRENQRQKMGFLKQCLGFEFDLDDLFKGKISINDNEVIKQYKDLYQICEGMSEKNTLLENKSTEMENKMNELKKENKELQEKFSKETIICRENILKAKNVTEELKTNFEYKVAMLEEQKQKCISKVLEDTHKIVEEKLQIVNNLNQMMETKPATVDIGKIHTYKEQTKASKINTNSVLKEQILKSHKNVVKGIDKNHKNIVKGIESKSEIIRGNYEDFKEKTKKEKESLLSEADELIQIAQKQQKTIEKIILGSYCYKKKPLPISEDEIPLQFNEKGYEKILKSLEKFKRKNGKAFRPSTTIL